MKPQKTTGRGKSGTRKYGRDLEKCKRYRAKNQREKNKKRQKEKREYKFAKRQEKRERKKMINKIIK